MALLKILECTKEGESYITNSFENKRDKSYVQFAVLGEGTATVLFSVDGKTFVDTSFKLDCTVGENMIEINAVEGIKIKVACTVNMSDIKVLL